MHILMAGREALLDISSVFLDAKNGYNSEGGWNPEAKIP
jgi:hypothetical protein